MSKAKVTTPEPTTPSTATQLGVTARTAAGLRNEFMDGWRAAGTEEAQAHLDAKHAANVENAVAWILSQ